MPALTATNLRHVKGFYKEHFHSFISWLAHVGWGILLGCSWECVDVDVY